MRLTWHSHDYDYESLFDNLRLEWFRGLEEIYFAEKGNRYYLIYDGRGVYGFLVAMTDSPEERQEIKNENFIQIIEFENCEARSVYCQETYPDDVVSRFAMKKYRDRQL